MPVAGQYIDNYNPALGEVYSLIPDSDEQDVEQAVQAALKAFPAWSNTPAEKRGQILMRIADLIDQNLEEDGGEKALFQSQRQSSRLPGHEDP